MLHMELFMVTVTLVPGSVRLQRSETKGDGASIAASWFNTCCSCIKSCGLGGDTIKVWAAHSCIADTSKQVVDFMS